MINVTQIGGVFMDKERNDENKQILKKIKEKSQKKITLEQIIALQKVKENSGNNESKSTKTRVDIMTPKQVWSLLSDKKKFKGIELYFKSGNNNFVMGGKRLPKDYFNIYKSNKDNRGFNENIFIILTRDLDITPKIQLSPEEKTIQDVQDALALNEYKKKRRPLSEKISDFKNEHEYMVLMAEILAVCALYYVSVYAYDTYNTYKAKYEENLELEEIRKELDYIPDEEFFPDYSESNNSNQ